MMLLSQKTINDKVVQEKIRPISNGVWEPNGCGNQMGWGLKGVVPKGVYVGSERWFTTTVGTK